MADTTYPETFSEQRPFARVFSALRLGLSMQASANARMHEIQTLSALSDEDLAARGLKRDEIPRYVFRDLMGF